MEGRDGGREGEMGGGAEPNIKLVSHINCSGKCWDGNACRRNAVFYLFLF